MNHSPPSHHQPSTATQTSLHQDVIYHQACIQQQAPSYRLSGEFWPDANRDSTSDSQWRK